MSDAPSWWASPSVAALSWPPVTWPATSSMTAAEVNTENLLAFDKIIITKDALEALGKRLQG